MYRSNFITHVIVPPSTHRLFTCEATSDVNATMDMAGNEIRMGHITIASIIAIKSTAELIIIFIDSCHSFVKPIRPPQPPSKENSSKTKH